MRYHLPNRLRNHERSGRCQSAQLPRTAEWLRGRELALNIAEHQQGPQGHDHWLDQRRMDSPEEEVCGQRDQPPAIYCARHQGTYADEHTDHSPSTFVSSAAERLGAKSFVCRGVSQGKTSPAYHSEKTYDFSALYICVRDRRVDEFWDAGWRAFVTTTGTCRKRRPQAVSKRWFVDASDYGGWVGCSA